VRISIEMIDARCVESARTSNNAMHFIAFPYQQVGQITSVLSGYARDERACH